MNVVKRLTKDYFPNLFDFYRSNKIDIVKDEIFDQWIESLSLLKDEHNTFFSEKYEFFFSGTFDDNQELNVEGAAVLKKCKTHSAIVKSIVFKKNIMGEFKENEYRNIIKAIEIYCAESGIKTIDFYTNSKNGTINYFLNQPTKYFMLFKRRIDNEANYEYVFRRKILIDYTGDPTNIRDLSLWFLDSIFVPFPNIEDSSSIIQINDIQAYKEIHFFTDLSSYQTGLFNLPYIEVPFMVISKSCRPDIITTRINLIAYILNNNLDKKTKQEVQVKLDSSTHDKTFIFSTLKDVEFTCRNASYITWQTITDQIRYIHQQYEETNE